jgi:hypothetical protein
LVRAAETRGRRKDGGVNVGRVGAALLACLLLVSCSRSTTTSKPSVATSITTATSASASSAPSTSASEPASSASASSAAPKATAAGPWTLSINGLGPLVVGTKFSVLQQQGYIDPGTDVCPQQGSSKKLQDEGVFLYPTGEGANAVLAEVGLTTATYATVSGARVGDTMKKLKQLYGTQLKIETKNGNGGPFQVANVHIGSREVVFYFPSGSSLGDTAVVQVMIARNWSADMMGEC